MYSAYKRVGFCENYNYKKTDHKRYERTNYQPDADDGPHRPPSRASHSDGKHGGSRAIVLRHRMARGQLLPHLREHGILNPQRGGRLGRFLHGARD